MAVFWLNPTTYTVNEDEGPAVVMVECTGGTLTFDIEVTFETVVAGSTATGIYKSNTSVMRIYNTV